MDPFNTSNFNSSSGLHEDVLNSSVGPTTKYVVDETNSDYVKFFVFVIFLLGLPGNLLVLAVYVRQLTTSTRVYMFALAVVDSVLCVCGIIGTTTAVGPAIILVIYISGEMSVSFSVLLLAFISTERLMAVRRPHTFSLSTSRAKIALIPITMVSIVYTSMLEVAKFLHYGLLSRIVVMILTYTSVLVMVVCYILMAETLLKNARAARSSVGIESGTRSRHPEPPTASTSAQDSSLAGKTVNKGSSKKAKTNKGVGMLFIITLVFIVCWMPKWLQYADVHIFDALEHLYLVNSIVNPLIYSVIGSMFRNDVRQFYQDTRASVAACYR